MNQQFNQYPNYQPRFRLRNNLVPYTEIEHAGRWFKREIFNYNELKAKQVAEVSGISEAKLSKFLNEKCDLDNDLAIRLSYCFGFNPNQLVREFAAYKLNLDLNKHNLNNAIFNYAVSQSPQLENLITPSSAIPEEAHQKI